MKTPCPFCVFGECLCPQHAPIVPVVTTSIVSAEQYGALFDAASKLTIAVRSGRGVTEALATLELVLDPEGEEVTGG